MQSLLKIKLLDGIVVFGLGQFARKAAIVAMHLARAGIEGYRSAAVGTFFVGDVFRVFRKKLFLLYFIRF